MKLAEALIIRGDLQKRVESLRNRITANARYQEGEEPAEDATALLGEVQEVLGQLEVLVAAINRTNSATAFESGTLTDALARRDILRLRHSILVGSADAAAGANSMGTFRQLRSELRQLTNLDTSALRAQADDVAKQLRELDISLQRANWEADLAE